MTSLFRIQEKRVSTVTIALFIQWWGPMESRNIGLTQRKMSWLLEAPKRHFGSEQVVMGLRSRSTRIWSRDRLTKVKHSRTCL